MATIAPPSHSRGPSMTTLESEVNPHFQFPAVAQPTPPSSTGSFQFPPIDDESNANIRRSSAPLDSIMPLETSYSRPRSKSSDALKQIRGASVPNTGLPSPVSPNNTGRAAGPPTPYYPGGSRIGGRVVGAGVSPTVLNATVTLGPVPEGKGTQHKRVTSELLDVPTLEPQEAEEKTALPSPQKPAPLPAGSANRPRRGHAHRRSGAISSGDVWSLLNQSAPSLPIPNSNSAREPSSAPEIPSSSPLLSHSAPTSPAVNDSPIMQDRANSVPDAETDPSPRQVRVSFIDRVEIIPRPMSSGTASTLSTVRGHAGKDSIGSLASLASPRASIDTTVRSPSPTRQRHNRTRSNSQTMLQPTAALRAVTDRPSTAGAILLSSPGCKAGAEDVANNVSSLKRPATASPGLAPSAPTSPTKSSPTKKTHKKAKSDFSPLISNSRDGSCSDGSRLNSATESSDSAAPKKEKKGKKQIKDWADNILGKGKRRRTKRGTKAKKRSPTPPLPRPDPSSPKESEWVTASWNESYVMMPVDHSPNLEIDSIAVFGVSEEKSPVIDLDAALGPFKTPTVPPSVIRRRRMHSATGRGGMHRRAESMPEMQLFALEEDELTPMDDVFEEEEEDEDDDSEGSDESSEEEEEEEGRMSGGDGLGIGLKDEAPMNQRWKGGSMDWNAPKVKNNDHLMVDDMVSPATSSPHSATEESAIPPSLKRKGAPMGIIMPAAAMSAHSSSSTVTSTSQLNLQPPLDSPATFVTAHSNLNTPVQPDFPSEDESFNPYNDYLGEPGPEMRMSVDDIPSLTSSSSTMTMSIGYSGLPPTPGSGEMLPLKEKDKKDKGKRWSRVWGFWRK